APVQLSSLLGLRHGESEDAEESRRDGAQPRRDGEVHLLRAAHQRGQDRSRETGPCGARRRDSDRLPAGLPLSGDRVRKHHRPREPGRQAESRGAELLAAGQPEHASADELSGRATESKSGAGEGVSVEDPKASGVSGPELAEQRRAEIIGPGYTFSTVTDKIS